MLTLPNLDIEALPMELDALGRLQFSKMREGAVEATFGLGIKAASTDEWEITSIAIGTQELRVGSETYRRFAQHLEAEHSGKIHDHINDNLSGARDDAAYDGKAFAMEWA